MAEYLSDEEHELVKKFIEDASKVFPNKESPTYTTAVKFLFARKFDIRRAVELYYSHEQTRAKERLTNINPFRERVRGELLSGKFTILSARDSDGATIALFTVRFHVPSTCSRLDLFRALLFQLDAALESIETQRYGLVFVYDMTECRFHNFDFDVSKKILSLLKDSYPARLKKVLIVNPPVWFKYPFKCLQILLKKKLQERVHMVTASQLLMHLPSSSIPRGLGGSLKVEHRNWLEECLTRNKSHHRFDVQSIENLFARQEVAMHRQENSRKHSANSIQSSGSANQLEARHDWAGLDLLAKARERRSIHQQPSKMGQVASETEMGVHEFVSYVNNLGSSGLSKLFPSLKNVPQNACFSSAKCRENMKKNRYADVLCLEESRVRLLGSKDRESSSSDYIHANFVDGYNTSCAYICTQGPLPHTTEDFWEMTWDHHVLIIVMLTKIRESGRVKCHQYWPLDTDSIDNYGDFAIINNGIDESNKDNSLIISSLLIQNIKTMEMREVIHLQFVGWPDYGAPNSSDHFLNFLVFVKKRQDELCSQLETRSPTIPTAPPILIHCSAGIGRSGTFVAMDISLDRLTKGDKKIDISGTIERIRSQRPGSVQTLDQFVFSHFALSDYVLPRSLM